MGRLSTTQEQLEAVQTAIAAILTGGQSITLADGTTYRPADLNVLYSREEVLTRRLSREQGRRPTFKSVDLGALES